MKPLVPAYALLYHFVQILLFCGYCVQLVDRIAQLIVTLMVQNNTCGHPKRYVAAAAIHSGVAV